MTDFALCVFRQGMKESQHARFQTSTFQRIRVIVNAGSTLYW